MKRAIKLVLLCAILIANFFVLKSIFLAMPARAEVAPAPRAAEGIKDWLISVVMTDSGFTIIDPQTGQVYGPFLEGELGPTDKYGSHLDVAVTPDGKTALISNFTASEIHFVDVSNPLNPSWMYSVTTPMFAEDIDISPDGRFALVTDGGFTPVIATIDILSHTLIFTNSTIPSYANAVAIAPDNTVVTADYFRGDINSHRLLPTGEVTYTIPYTNPYLGEHRTMPVNVAIAPDGQTVLVATVMSDVVSVYQITAPGVLTFKNFVEGVPDGMQSIAFNDAGDKAYVVSKGEPIEGTINYSHNQLSVLDILGPGQVELNTAAATSLASPVTSQLFGVDVLAAYGNYLFANNMALTGAVTQTTMVNLTDYTTQTLFTGRYPAGIDVIYQPRPLTVQKTGAGTGVVQSLPAGINCGSACTSNFNRNYFNNVVTLTATADPEMLFTGWGGDCTGSGDCVIDLAEARPYTVTAEFSHGRHWFPFAAYIGEPITDTIR